MPCQQYRKVKSSTKKLPSCSKLDLNWQFGRLQSGYRSGVCVAPCNECTGRDAVADTISQLAKRSVAAHSDSCPFSWPGRPLSLVCVCFCQVLPQRGVWALTCEIGTWQNRGQDIAGVPCYCHGAACDSPPSCDRFSPNADFTCNIKHQHHAHYLCT